MEQLTLEIEHHSKSRIIASSGVFQVELLQHVGEDDYPQLISISEHLSDEYGEKAVLSKVTIHKYFNKPSSLPFIARYRDEIIGFIIGVAIEDLSSEPWARLDENFGEGNTLYTYAFVIMDKYLGNGYAKILKRVYLSWAKKRDGIRFITGHVKLGKSSKFTGDIKIVNRVDNWQGTGLTFEYYSRNLGTKPDLTQTHNPPLAKTI